MSVLIRTGRAASSQHIVLPRIRLQHTVLLSQSMFSYRAPGPLVDSYMEVK